MQCVLWDERARDILCTRNHPRTNSAVERAVAHAHAQRMRRRRRDKSALVPIGRIERTIIRLRGHSVMIDSDLADLYGVTTKRLNEQVRRNVRRFPADFMFQLTPSEAENLRSQFATSSSSSHGGRRSLPFVFTEHGAIMAATILNSARAVQTSIRVVRAFVAFRQLLESNGTLAKRLAALERRYDGQFAVVFKAIRELMSPSPRARRRIGFS